MEKDQNFASRGITRAFDDCHPGRAAENIGIFNLNEIKPRGNKTTDTTTLRAPVQETREKHVFPKFHTKKKRKKRKPFLTSPGRPGAMFGKGSARGTMIPDSTSIIPNDCKILVAVREKSLRQVRHELHRCRVADAFYTRPIMHCARRCCESCPFMTL